MKRDTEEILWDFRANKFSMFVEVGNMKDINDMSMKDFINLCKYLEYKNKKDSGGIVPLKKSQKEMIEVTKAKEAKK